MTKWLDGVLGVPVQSVAGCLMFGVFLAAWQCALDAVAGRTVYTLMAFFLAVGGGMLAGGAVA